MSQIRAQLAGLFGKSGLTRGERSRAQAVGGIFPLAQHQIIARLLPSFRSRDNRPILRNPPQPLRVCATGTALPGLSKKRTVGVATRPIGRGSAREFCYSPFVRRHYAKGGVLFDTDRVVRLCLPMRGHFFRGKFSFGGGIPGGHLIPDDAASPGVAGLVRSSRHPGAVRAAAMCLLPFSVGKNQPSARGDTLRGVVHAFAGELPAAIALYHPVLVLHFHPEQARQRRIPPI